MMTLCVVMAVMLPSDLEVMLDEALIQIDVPLDKCYYQFDLKWNLCFEQESVDINAFADIVDVLNALTNCKEQRAGLVLDASRYPSLPEHECQTEWSLLGVQVCAFEASEFGAIAAFVIQRYGIEDDCQLLRTPEVPDYLVLVEKQQDVLHCRVLH